MIVVGFLLFGVFGAGVTGVSPVHQIQKRALSYEFTTSELAANWGYDVEEHEITTEDGYIFAIYRVKRKGQSMPYGKRTFLFLAGFATSSDHYFLSEDHPFVSDFINEGCDIWLGNVRGGRYGKKHKYKSVTDVNFWDFSWHEIAIYDLPATIDYILEKTNNSKIGYGGYSAGTTIFYAMMSKRPEYNEKLAVAFIIAPVVYWRHTRNIFMDVLALVASPLYEMALQEKMLDILALEHPVIELTKEICSNAELFPYLCRPLLVTALGHTDERESDYTVRSFIRYMCSTGFKLVVHYAQVYHSGKFREYKYPTASANLLKYGSVEPPEYNISSATAPIVIVAAYNDNFVAFEDIDILVKAAPNLVSYEKFPYQYYGHFSMAGAKNSTPYLHQKLLPILHKISFD